LSGKGPLIQIDPASKQAAGFVPIWLAVPLGVTRPQPIVIVQESVQQNVEGFCRRLHALMNKRPFVLCQYRRAVASALVGSPQSKSVERQLRHALKFTKQRFGRHVAAGGAVLVAIDESGRQAAELVSQEPGFFSRVLSLSQRFEAWSSSNATNFGRAGGKRILLSSAREADMNTMLHRSSLFKRAGAEARVAGYEGAWAPEPVIAFVAEHWAWLVAEDERFEQNPRGAR
jgi:hypothetical protein